MKPAEIMRVVERAKQDLVGMFKQQPYEFFTENDLTAYFAGRIHHQLSNMDCNRLLAHMEYPTPFRCDMSDGHFNVRGEEERNTNKKLYQRGHFDLTVFNPAFLDECEHNYILKKGQKWEVLQPFLKKKNDKSPVAALCVYELMFLRDAFLRKENQSRGKKTMQTVIKMVIQDWDKLQHALMPMESGYKFAQAAEMLVFTNGLGEFAVNELINGVPKGVKVISTSPVSARNDVFTNH